MRPARSDNLAQIGRLVTSPVVLAEHLDLYHAGKPRIFHHRPDRADRHAPLAHEPAIGEKVVHIRLEVADVKREQPILFAEQGYLVEASTASDFSPAAMIP